MGQRPLPAAHHRRGAPPEPGRHSRSRGDVLRTRAEGELTARAPGNSQPVAWIERQRNPGAARAPYRVWLQAPNPGFRVAQPGLPAGNCDRRPMEGASARYHRGRCASNAELSVSSPAAGNVSSCFLEPSNQAQETQSPSTAFTVIAGPPDFRRTVSPGLKCALDIW